LFSSDNALTFDAGSYLYGVWSLPGNIAHFFFFIAYYDEMLIGFISVLFWTIFLYGLSLMSSCLFWIFSWIISSIFGWFIGEMGLAPTSGMIMAPFIALSGPCLFIIVKTIFFKKKIHSKQIETFTNEICPLSTQPIAALNGKTSVLLFLLFSGFRFCVIQLLSGLMFFWVALVGVGFDRPGSWHLWFLIIFSLHLILFSLSRFAKFLNGRKFILRLYEDFILINTKRWNKRIPLEGITISPCINDAVLLESSCMDSGGILIKKSPDLAAFLSEISTGIARNTDKRCQLFSQT
jgi:hypothetical protein